VSAGNHRRLRADLAPAGPFHELTVHPAEFLVTGPEGSILSRTILGDRLLIAPGDQGGELDRNRVFYFDLELEGN
jgi:hypothetical protein